MTKPILSVVVPCFNEEECLRALHDRLTNVCKNITDAYEILLINDGSRDASWAIMADLAAQDSHVAAINLSRRFGHQIALSAGLSLCHGQRILILDADLQDPPESLPGMMALMDQGADVVYGLRTNRAGEGFFKRASAHLFYRFLSRMAEVDLPRDAGDFRLISRRALDILNRMPERSRYIRGMVGWIGLKQVPFPYERAPRLAGQTHYPLGKMLRFALSAITSFSVAPLRLASLCGIGIGLISLLMLFYALVAWLLGDTVEGWTSMVMIILTLGSLQLIGLGIMGEYMGHLYMESKARPLFIVDEVIRAQDPAAPT